MCYKKVDYTGWQSILTLFINEPVSQNFSFWKLSLENWKLKWLAKDIICKFLSLPRSNWKFYSSRVYLFSSQQFSLGNFGCNGFLTVMLNSCIFSYASIFLLFTPQIEVVFPCTISTQFYCQMSNVKWPKLCLDIPNWEGLYLRLRHVFIMQVHQRMVE